MQAIKVHLSMAVQPPSVTILLDPILFKEVRTHKTRKKKKTQIQPFILILDKCHHQSLEYR